MHQLRDDNTLYVTLSLRKYFPMFFFQGLIFLVLLAVYLLISAGSFESFGIEANSLASRIYLIVFSLITLIMLGTIVERILYTKSFKIEFSPKNLEYTYGIFNKTVESVDMHVITDYVKKRGPIDQILGIGNILIHSEDVRTPEIRFDGLLVPDARAIIEYLQANAANTLVEYLINKRAEEGGEEPNSPVSDRKLYELQMMEEQETLPDASNKNPKVKQITKEP